MGGSTIAQFIWNGYAHLLGLTATQVVNNILSSTVPWVQAALALYVMLAGKRMLANATSFDRESTAVIRAIVVATLLTPANFNTFITTEVTQTIPNAIASAVNGQTDLTAAQGFDSLLNAISNFAAQLFKQAVGVLYISERITIWLAQGAASFFVMCCLFVWMLAQAAIAFIVPIGAFIIPFYLFDTTREFTMRWVGKLISLFLVLAISLILGAFVVKLDAQFMQQFAQTAIADRANPGFSMNSGEGTFGEGGLAAFGEGPAAVATTDPGTTANITSSINALWNVALVCAFGAFILAIMVGIALYIGGSSGFSAAPAASFIMTVATAGANRILGRRRP